MMAASADEIEQARLAASRIETQILEKHLDTRDPGSSPWQALEDQLRALVREL